jgi:hypothetical protein
MDAQPVAGLLPVAGPCAATRLSGLSPGPPGLRAGGLRWGQVANFYQHLERATWDGRIRSGMCKTIYSAVAIVKCAENRAR